MIRAFCFFCGQDCDRNALYMTLTPFQDFARYTTDTKPYGYQGDTKGYVICSSCRKKHNLPNPYMDYKLIDDQKLRLEVSFDNYPKKEE